MINIYAITARSFIIKTNKADLFLKLIINFLNLGNIYTNYE